MKRKRGKSWEKISEHMTEWIGSTHSLLVHTLIFMSAFALILVGFDTNTILLFLTTIVSLEAIYLSIFIQMTVNRHAESLEEVEEDIGEIQEDVHELSEDIEEISEDIEEIQEEEEGKETKVTLENIEGVLQKALKDLEQFKRQQ
jgi:peptidoglycan hydrolase CwlO-like protein